jgi:hypothetical protein
VLHDLQKMKLIQKRGRQHDSLELDGDRIIHSWSLKKENGERSTDIENLDPEVAFTERKSEGKLPYFTIGFIFLLLLWFGYPGEGILGRVLTGLFIGACIASFLVGFSIRGKENVTILHLKDGSVFAVIRHHWVGAKEREAFLSSLENRFGEIKAE